MNQETNILHDGHEYAISEVNILLKSSKILRK